MVNGEVFLRDRWSIIHDSTRHLYLTPKKSGIYCFIKVNSITKKREVIYVGKSENLSIRLKPWHKIEHLFHERNKCFGDFLTTKIMLTDDFHKKEIEYITRLKPLFNIKHNPNIKRKIIYQNGETIY